MFSLAKPKFLISSSAIFCGWAVGKSILLTIGEIYMAWCIDQVKNILLTFKSVFHPDRCQFDGYTPFPFNRIGIQNLIHHFSFFDSSGDFQYPVCQSTFSMVYMSYYGKISDKFRVSHDSKINQGDEFYVYLFSHVSAGGFEPPTDSLRGSCSTVELCAPGAPRGNRTPISGSEDRYFIR
ncbi:MAG: hypothetical protein UV09_C0018G0019 [Candidatus Gottesmanbacteria bacterium GW2011_GWA2_42_18]|uniref:Uncharacterized protein n=1 Tax=Candidatus Gottesmanbacteria bacterium GW2011_GWA2_42_18 TaxID=1618442 RepID=A0A0G1C9N4_9BACT|nr:MAG: hypothetical protein UV09_C0018G0019 [Candidatus Gottesmanbacteria bacterium GW2011_GWA2_42_18]